jgi:hypothetical protein
MQTRNEVPFIVQVSVIPYGCAMKVPSICCTKGYCCDVAVAQINYPSFKHDTQDSIEQARGRSHEEGSSQIFMLDDMQFRGGLDVI